MAEAGCILEAGEGGLRSSKPGDVLMAEYLMSHQVLFGIECWECWGSITEKRDMDVSTRISSWGSGNSAHSKGGRCSYLVSTFTAEIYGGSRYPTGSYSRKPPRICGPPLCSVTQARQRLVNSQRTTSTSIQRSQDSLAHNPPRRSVSGIPQLALIRQTNTKDILSPRLTPPSCPVPDHGSQPSSPIPGSQPWLRSARLDEQCTRRKTERRRPRRDLGQAREVSEQRLKDPYAGARPQSRRNPCRASWRQSRPPRRSPATCRSCSQSAQSSSPPALSGQPRLPFPPLHLPGPLFHPDHTTSIRTPETKGEKTRLTEQASCHSPPSNQPTTGPSP